MCGIFGAVGRDVPGPALEAVFAVLEHRGPDGSGLLVDEHAQLTLAHRRLAVIDLETGDQPIANEDGNVVVDCNGEIYDFERIRASLEAQGHRFRTRSDSEVIVHLYEEFGLNCFEHLRGEFAFLLYDKVKRLLIAARDRFGIKPLYLARFDGGLVFASEMKAIFASGLVEAKLDAVALDPFLERDPDHVRFPFAGIEHVPPGSYLAVDLETPEARVTRYWSPEIPASTVEPIADPTPDRAEAAAQTVLRELEEAVRLRLRADVPVGLYLSGGIDSTFVGALMQRNLTTSLHSFSIAFTGSERDEGGFARRAADLLGTTHHELAVTNADLWAHLEDAVWFSELPFVTLAPVGKFLLSREARKHVTVVLTGEGADEVFLGYRSYFRRAIRDTRAEGRKGGASAQARRLKLGGLAGALAPRLSLLLFRKDHRARLAAARAEPTVSPRPTKPVVNAVQEARIAGMPLDILCYLGDREEMAHSLEARLPFLDHKLFDAARAIPVDLKMRGDLEKAVLRDAAKGILPDDLRLRRKTGFMLTSEAVDLFGTDRVASHHVLSRYLSKEAFARAGVFSWRAYRLASLVARFPASKVRRNANKVIMYMLQTHMLHDMFVIHPRWKKGPG